jgi:hypothetical protein
MSIPICTIEDRHPRRRKGKPGRVRAKEFRQRRKEYVKNLEEKVEFLESEVKRLFDENHSLRKHSLRSSSEHSTIEEVKKPYNKSDRLRQEEDFYYNKIPSMIQANEKVNFTMIEQ